MSHACHGRLVECEEACDRTGARFAALRSGGAQVVPINSAKVAR